METSSTQSEAAATEAADGLTEEQLALRKARIKFWTLFGFWVLFALIIPVGFIAWRYHLFTQISRIQFGGWGMIALIIAFAFGVALCKYVKKGMGSSWSYPFQIVAGLAKVVLPLACLFFVLVSVRESIDEFIQALGVALFSEAAGIFVNPMPKWVAERSKGRTMEMLDYLIDQRDAQDAAKAKK